jgi:hypothetical protein
LKLKNDLFGVLLLCHNGQDKKNCLCMAHLTSFNISQK